MLRKLSNKFYASLSLPVFAGCVSLFTLICYNIPFLKYAWEHAHIDFLPKVLLFGSLVLILFILNFMMTHLVMFLLRRVGRILIALTLFINALAVYFILTYQVLMDESMLGNVFNTRYSEASVFFSWSLVLFVVLLGVLPALYVLFKPVEYGTWKKLGISCGGSLSLTLILLLVNINQTLWIGQHDTELGGLVMPWSYVVNTIRIASLHHDENVEEIPLPDATIQDEQKAAVVLVIGESARSFNFQLYGYKRSTNPLLSQQKDLFVYPAKASATYTTAGTKAILEPNTSGPLYEILPNYAFRTGVDVSWRTYNWGEPPVHIDEYLSDQDLAKIYPDVDATYDEILFTGLKERIESSTKNKVLIILHTSTSHGPDYCKKYPKSFEKFTPVLDNVEQANKEKERLVNAYDNSILYTDYLVSNLIDTLKTMTDWKTAMIYVSDHGESLGENNMFMHGLPMSMAPAEQYEIPFLVWVSPGFRALKPLGNSKEGTESSLSNPLDQHYVFHSVLNLLSIQSPAYNSAFDLFIRE